MKNPNQYGSVKKLSGKRRRPYAAVITTGWIQYFDDNGLPAGKPRQQRKYIGYYATRREALSALATYNASKERSVYQHDKETPVNALKQAYVPTFEQLWNDVLSTRREFWSKSTTNNYISSFNRCSSIHKKRVDLITYMDLQKEMNKYMREKKTAGVLKLYKVFFTMLFSEAVKNGYIQQSPAQYITYKATADNKRRKVITTETIHRIKLSNCKSRDIVLILLYTGLRINELLKLKAWNVHFDEHYLIAGSKTASGKNRTVPIHPEIESTLRKFLNENRGIYETVKGWLTEDCEKFYGEKFTYHECRHTFISQCTKVGIDIAVIKKIVGHSSKDITESVYTHLDAAYLYEQILRLHY